MSNNILPGDHLRFFCGTHFHHGIYCGDIFYQDHLYQDVVIHFEGKHKRGQISLIPYEKFAQNREIQVVEYEKGACYNHSLVVQRAINKLGETGYNLVTNNCEHFAHWCKTGKHVSSQVNRYLTPIRISLSLIRPGKQLIQQPSYLN